MELVDNMNYSKLIDNILEIAIHQKGISTAFEQDIYQLNNMTNVQYPCFNVSPTEPQQEHQNYFEYVLTLYYIDREQYGNNEYHNPNTTLIHSNGISILSNIIKKIREIDGVIDVDENIQYICWSDTQVFADKCNGVYATIHIKTVKESLCFTD